MSERPPSQLEMPATKPQGSRLAISGAGCDLQTEITVEGAIGYQWVNSEAPCYRAPPEEPEEPAEPEPSYCSAAQAV